MREKLRGDGERTNNTLLTSVIVVDVKGDIFNSDCDVFIHCCNCFHKVNGTGGWRRGRK